MRELFFVYGTLKKGYGNNVLLADSKFLGQAVTKKLYKLYNCGFPMAYPSVVGLPVVGELYEVVSTRVIETLDYLESNGSLYTRAKLPVSYKGGEEEAWIYEGTPWHNNPSLCPIHPEQEAYWWFR